MRINIALPRHFGYISLIYKTYLFFRPKHISSLYVDKDHRFYIFLERKRIIIRIESEDVHVHKEIAEYLEYAFKNSYVGVPKKFGNYFVLQGVDTFFV